MSQTISLPCLFGKAQAKKNVEFFLRGFGWVWFVPDRQELLLSVILAFQVFGFAATIVFAFDFYITFNDLVAFLKQGSSEPPEGHKAEGG